MFPFLLLLLFLFTTSHGSSWQVKQVFRGAGCSSRYKWTVRNRTGDFGCQPSNCTRFYNAPLDRDEYRKYDCAESLPSPPANYIGWVKLKTPCDPKHPMEIENINLFAEKMCLPTYSRVYDYTKTMDKVILTRYRSECGKDGMEDLTFDRFCVHQTERGYPYVGVEGGTTAPPRTTSRPFTPIPQPSGNPMPLVMGIIIAAASVIFASFVAMCVYMRKRRRQNANVPHLELIEDHPSADFEDNFEDEDLL
jgi:hypothetical protein